MITYVAFESAFQLLTVAYMLPMLMLVLASAVGVAVIETIEEVGEL